MEKMSCLFSRIGVFGKYNGIQSWEVIEKLIQFLQNHTCQVLLDASSCDGFPAERYQVELVERSDLLNNIDLAIVVGGDGTFLTIARALVDYQIPILGVNLGRLGFLTDISPSTMQKVLRQVLLEEHYQLEERILLHVRIEDDQGLVFEDVAFNDVVLHKNDSPRMIEFETFINERFFSSQRSDGIIISTPTGSTAYSLSAGGPILDSNLEVFTLVSINPHTMSNRPVVVSGDSCIRIRPHENCDGIANIICDGQVTFQISGKHTTYITRHHQLIKMIHPHDYDHFELWRAKLNWGQKLS